MSVICCEVIDLAELCRRKAVDSLEGSLAWWQVGSGKCDRLRVCAQHTYVRSYLAGPTVDLQNSLKDLGQEQYCRTYICSIPARFLLYSSHTYMHLPCSYCCCAGVLHLERKSMFKPSVTLLRVLPCDQHLRGLAQAFADTQAALPIHAIQIANFQLR